MSITMRNICSYLPADLFNQPKVVVPFDSEINAVTLNSALQWW